MKKPDPEKDLPALRKHVERMIVTTQKVIDRPLNYNEADHYAFMLLCFLMKQSEHVRSVAILVDAAQYRDATAIARMMLEGMSTLMWAACDRTNRPLQWRAYALVSDWELLCEKKANGEDVDLEMEKRLCDRLKRHGPKFLTKRARRDGANDTDWRFQKTWLLDAEGSHITRSSMFEEIKGESLYELYEDFSQWLHWTPRALGDCIVRNEDGRTAYNPNSYRQAAQALVVAFLTTLQTLKLVYEHFKIQSKPPLDQLKMEFLKDIGVET
ncbi:hypothetical protein FO488_15915 [Geobacter sp. FeAm09]|uniref:DUF5677 domain-containing protein n=1 Tax=Geobacter sp. FeAm09 TaxID=2597769 RepID=UPI0011F05222|nr:DUF5677 domain-containing protein [Geobacter sp. FeAm09]QEM69494.1 hypothetical protein FO488_15915 [Geobacter sp. FeAm09]